MSKLCDCALWLFVHTLHMKSGKGLFLYSNCLQSYSRVSMFIDNNGTVSNKYIFTHTLLICVPEWNQIFKWLLCIHTCIRIQTETSTSLCPLCVLSISKLHNLWYPRLKTSQVKRVHTGDRVSFTQPEMLSRRLHLPRPVSNGSSCRWAPAEAAWADARGYRKTACGHSACHHDDRSERPGSWCKG